MLKNNDRSEPVKSLAEARAEFIARGKSISEWARENGFSANLVFDILGGRKKCLRGQSHQIAVRLGIKQGIADEITNWLLNRRKNEARLGMTNASNQHVAMKGRKGEITMNP